MTPLPAFLSGLALAFGVGCLLACSQPRDVTGPSMDAAVEIITRDHSPTARCPICAAPMWDLGGKPLCSNYHTPTPNPTP